MQRRASRTARRAAVVAVVAALGAVVWQLWFAENYRTIQAPAQTSWGPLMPAHRNLLVKIRMVSLWEMTTGQQAQQQATRPEIKDAARKVVADRTEIDQKVRATADKLGILLPSTPSAQQISWMREITSKTGTDYDQTFVQHVREPDGETLSLSHRSAPALATT